jgi:YD repeat-containing protein
MTTRFFEHYYASDPMTELTEAEARARDSHVELIEAPFRHYLAVFERQIERVIYPDLAPDEAIVRFHAERYQEAPLWIVSRVELDDAGAHYDIWYYDSISVQPTRVHYDTGKTRRLETFYDEAGRLTGSNERRFHDWGEHIETISRDAAGRIVSIDD